MDQTFHRIKRLPPYVFAEVNAMKASARAAGEDVIDFGMGNPDSATPQHIVDKLAVFPPCAAPRRLITTAVSVSISTRRRKPL